MKPLSFESASSSESGSNVPSSVTLLVSLFLILLVFFIIINNSSERNNEKKEAAMRSMTSKFGKPSDDKINFGGIAKPKVEDYALKLETLLGEAAKIESSLNGEKTIIRLKKSDFYFADEPSIRPNQADNINEAIKIIEEMNKAQPLKVTILLGLEDFRIDKKRLTDIELDFSHAGIFKTDIGLVANNDEIFTITVNYD